MKQQILPQKMKHKLQKVDIDQLQDQRKKKKIKNQHKIPLSYLPTPPLRQDMTQGQF